MNQPQDGEQPTTLTPRSNNPVEPLSPRARNEPTQAMRWEGGGFSANADPAPNHTVILNRGPQSFAWLVILNGPWAGHLFRLNPKGMVIGRDGRCDIILDEEAVSGLHAKVWSVGDEGGHPRFVIQDLASTNGTQVNGESIIKLELGDGDRIGIGQTTLVFKQV